MTTTISEAEAVRVALAGSRGKRLWVAARSLSRLMRNPEQTEEVFIMSLALNARAFPKLRERFRADANGRALLRDRPAIDSHHVDFAQLMQLPAETLGGAFARHMADQKLDPDLFQPPPGLPDDEAYIIQRIRQTHDLWHLLTGYRTDVTGEVALQGFTYGQLGVPSSLTLAALGTLRFAAEARGGGRLALARKVRAAIAAGRAAAWLPVIRWEDWWHRPLADVRSELRIVPPNN